MRRASTGRLARPRPEPSTEVTNPHEQLTVAELKVSRSTFYDWRAKRLSPMCIRLPNGALRIRRADLDAWLAAKEVA